MFKLLAKIPKYLQRLTRKDRFVAAEIPRLHIETTNFCNSNCVFCANAAMTRRTEVLKPDLFEGIVDDYKAMGGTQMDFNVTIGDPLLDKQIYKRARYAREQGMSGLGFVTTLQWLHRHDVEEFVRLFDWVSVSTTLTGAETYHEFFGVDLYEQMLSNLRLLLATMEKVRPDFGLHIGVKPTADSIGEVMAHPDFKEIDRLHKGQDLVASLKSRSVFVDDWAGAVNLPDYLKKRPLLPRYKRPCRFLYETIHVHSNGNVAACACRDYNANSELVVGNVREKSLGDLWNGEELASLRDDWRGEKPGAGNLQHLYVLPDVESTIGFHRPIGESESQLDGVE